MIPKRSDTAATADWGFTNRPGLMEALGRQAGYLASRWRLDADDLLQETYLWLAVRPEIQALDTPLILHHTRSVAQKLGEKQARLTGREVPLDRLE